MPISREATVVALYVSILLLATLSALPGDYDEPGHGGPALVLVIWGTAIGTALAHWFAFQVVALGFNDGRFSLEDVREVGAQIGAAFVVATLTTVVTLLAPTESAVEWAAFVPAACIGAAAYLAVRPRVRSPLTAVAFACAILTVGVAVATIKAVIAGH